MQTSCDYFISIYTLYIVVSSFCLSDIHLTSTRGTIKRTVGALNVKRIKLLSPWEPFIRSVGLGLAPLHILRRALDPLTSAHINLAKYWGYYCNVSVAAPLVLLSHLCGVDESSAPWETASLISFHEWISRATSYTRCLISLTISQTEYTSCSKSLS